MILLVKQFHPTVLAAFGLSLCWSSLALGDVVTQPVRTFGLGELRMAAVSPDGRFLATAGQGGGQIGNQLANLLRHTLNVAIRTYWFPASS
jgi:hypothetical protein